MTEALSRTTALQLPFRRGAGVPVLPRIASAVFVLWAAFTLTFILLTLLPSDAIQLRFDADGASYTSAQLEAIRAYYGFDRPALARYLDALLAAVRGDLGYSIASGLPVGERIAEALRSTVPLAAAAAVVALVVAVSVSVLVNLPRRESLRRLLGGIPPVLGSVPSFWLGAVLINIVCFQLGWLPSLSRDSAQALILPSITLGLVVAAPIAQVLTFSLSEAMDSPHVLLLRAHGFRRSSILFRDGLAQASVPAVTLAALAVGDLLAGSIAVETVFGRAGLGAVAKTAIEGQDLPMLQGVVLFVAAAFVTTSLLADLITHRMRAPTAPSLASGSRNGR